MNDELLRQRYINLRVKLVDLKDCLLKVEDLYNYVNLIFKDTLMINDKIVREDEYSNIISVNNDIRNEISTVIIPMIDKNL